MDGVASAALRTTIVAVESTLSTDGAVYAVTIDVDAPSEDLQAFDLGSTVIRGNVVGMGHGETKGPKVLGSGDATQNRQTFVLDAKDIAFVADRTADAGVRAEIGLSVGGRFWREVSLYQPIDLHDFTYRVGLTEAGTLRVTLDQRVATGVNNVRVEWRREGVGTAGNGVPPGGLGSLRRSTISSSGSASRSRPPAGAIATGRILARVCSRECAGPEPGRVDHRLRGSCEASQQCLAGPVLP